MVESFSNNEDNIKVILRTLVPSEPSYPQSPRTLRALVPSEPSYPQSPRTLRALVPLEPSINLNSGDQRLAVAWRTRI